MSVDAFLTRLGTALPSEDFFRSRTAWMFAREEEERLLQMVEQRINTQVQVPVRLTGSVLDGSLPPGGEAANLQLHETVGGTDGIAPLQAFPTWVLLDEVPPNDWRFDDPFLPLRRARDHGFRLPLAEFRHLLDHDPLNGYYLPVDFPDPIWIPGVVRGESYDISFGSANRLSYELERWRQLSRTMDVPDWLVSHWENLNLVTGAALRTGLALGIA